MTGSVRILALGAFMLPAAMLPSVRIAAQEAPPAAEPKGSAVEDAKSIMDALTVRSSLPPVAAIARLEASSPEVARSIGELLPKRSPSDVAIITARISATKNSSLHAALLVAMSASAEDMARHYFGALAGLDYLAIVQARDAFQKVHPNLLDNLKSDTRWRDVLREELLKIGEAARAGTSETEAARHRMLALCVVVDLFAGQSGFELALDQLRDLLVGEPEDAIALPPDQPEKAPVPPDDDDEDEDEAEPEQPNDSAESDELARQRQRIEIRLGAIETFRRLFLIDPSRFNLGRSTPHAGRVIAGTELKAKLREFYGADVPASLGFLQHLAWMSARGDEKFDRDRALLAMDELCGGVKIPAPPKPKDAAKPAEEKPAGEKPAAEKPQGEKPAEEDGPELVPVFAGENTVEKLTNFNLGDSRNFQRPGMRAIRKAFKERYGI